MSFFVLWFLMVVGKIAAWLGIMAFIAAVVGCICAIASHHDDGKVSTFSKCMIATAIIFSLMATVVPDKKEIAMIVAGGVTYEVVTSDAAKELGGKSLGLLNKKLDELIADEPEVKKEVSGTKL